MSNEESTDLLGSLSDFLASQRAVVDGLIVIEKACYVPTLCRATKEDWDALLEMLKKWMGSGAEFSRVVRAYTEVVRVGYRDEFLSGFYMALVRTERLDLLEEYPEVELISAVIEAQKIARNIEPPQDDASSEA